MNANTYKYYLLDLISILKEKNKELQKEAKVHKDDFVQGQLFSYFDMLTILKQQALAFGIDEKELGIIDILEKDLITEMFKE